MEKEIRVEKVASNKNYILGQIYNLSGEITANRILLTKLDSVKAEMDTNFERLETATASEGQVLYEENKRKKELKKKIDQNNIMIEKTEDILDNKEEQCQLYQEELEDAVDYELPKKER